MDGLYRNSENGLLEFFKREMGLSPPRIFSRRTLIEHIDLYGKLNGHQGCVNSVAFNSTGELLVSGSDDRQIMLWDWAAEKLKFSYPSGHLDNIFQARIMPFTDDCKIITSSANYQVRLSQVLGNGSVETKRLSKHQGRVHSLAVEPGSPYVFYRCGEDGFVQHYDLRSCSATKLFYCSSFAENNWSSSMGLNSIVTDPRNPNYFAVGGADVYARVYDIRKYQVNVSTKQGSPVNTFCTHHLTGTDDVHITALAFSNTSELLVSYNDELIYLFQKNMGLGSNPLSSPSEDFSTLNNISMCEQIMEANRQGREDHSWVTFTPDVIMHVLRRHRRQAQVYTERRCNREDIESDEDDEREAYLVGFSDVVRSEDDGNSRECNIN
ncbi:hypothetical protein Pfo_018135 [Paulownia fortunei]|nr:hypothetical protein Pfo_018135 [Paulownia fortunei]